MSALHRTDNAQYIHIHIHRGCWSVGRRRPRVRGRGGGVLGRRWPVGAWARFQVCPPVPDTPHPHASPAIHTERPWMDHGDMDHGGTGHQGTEQRATQSSSSRSPKGDDRRDRPQRRRRRRPTAPRALALGKRERERASERAREQPRRRRADVRYVCGEPKKTNDNDTTTTTGDTGVGVASRSARVLASTSSR